MTMGDHEPGRDGMPDDEHLAGGTGSSTLNEYLMKLALTMREMERGLRPIATLDSQASPMAARRIRQQLYLEMRAHPENIRHAAPLHSLYCTSSHPSAGVAEGVVVTECGKSLRTYSIRLEEEDGHWLIVELASPDTMDSPAVTTASRTGSVPIGSDGIRRSTGGVDVDVDRDVDIDVAGEEDRPRPEDRGPEHPEDPEDDGPKTRGPKED